MSTYDGQVESAGHNWGTMEELCDQLRLRYLYMIMPTAMSMMLVAMNIPRDPEEPISKGMPISMNRRTRAIAAVLSRSIAFHAWIKEVRSG